jgi:hypothetical protein
MTIIMELNNKNPFFGHFEAKEEGLMWRILAPAEFISFTITRFKEDPATGKKVKDNTPLENMPDIIDIQTMCHPRLMTSLKYYLVAFIECQGATTSAWHFVGSMLRKDKTGKVIWYVYNDATVEPWSAQFMKIAIKNAYILFYVCELVFHKHIKS